METAHQEPQGGGTFYASTQNLSGVMNSKPSHESLTARTARRDAWPALRFSAWSCLLQVAPVGPEADFHYDGHSQFVNAFHLFLNESLQLAALLPRCFEQQLVVDLQNHFCLEFLLGQAGVNVDHRELDEISGGALQRRIERRAFRKIAQLHLRRVDFRNRADSSKQSLRHAGLAGLRKNIVKVLLDSSIAREIRE